MSTTSIVTYGTHTITDVSVAWTVEDHQTTVRTTTVAGIDRTTIIPAETWVHYSAMESDDERASALVSDCYGHTRDSEWDILSKNPETRRYFWTSDDEGEDRFVVADSPNKVADFFVRECREHGDEGSVVLTVRECTGPNEGDEETGAVSSYTIRLGDVWEGPFCYEGQEHAWVPVAKRDETTTHRCDTCGIHQHTTRVTGERAYYDDTQAMPGYDVTYTDANGNTLDA